MKEAAAAVENSEWNCGDSVKQYGVGYNVEEKGGKSQL